MIILIHFRDLQLGNVTFLSVSIKSLVKYYLKNVPHHTTHLHNPFQLVHPKGRMELERMTPKTSQNILFVFGYRSRPWRIPDAFSPSFCIRSKFQSCRRVTGSAKSTAEPEKKRCLVSGAQPRLAGARNPNSHPSISCQGILQFRD